MPLPIIATIENPQQRTCASYKVDRLGPFPFMEMVFTETVNDVVPITVVSASDTDDDGKFDTLVVAIPPSPPFDPLVPNWVSEIVGRSLLKVDNSVLGVCASVEEDLSIKLVAGVDVDPTGLVLHYPHINGFGELIARPALQGKSYTRILSASVPAQMAKMQEVLGAVAFNLAYAVVTQLGLTASPQQIGGALIAMAANGDNLDSFIVRELEVLQASIDSGETDLG